MGKLKCNMDASLFSYPFKSGYGCVIQDEYGQFVASLQGTTMGKHSPILAEALSIQEAFSWLKNLQVREVVVESDSQSLINALNQNDVDFSSFGLVIENCKTMQKVFNHCSFVFVRKSVNRVAHCLAKEACYVSGQDIRVSYPPPFIFDVLEMDLIL